MRSRAGIAAGLLLVACGLAGCAAGDTDVGHRAASPAGEVAQDPITIQSFGLAEDNYIAMLFAEALRQTGRSAETKFIEDTTIEEQGAPATLSLVYDLDLLEHLAGPEFQAVRSQEFQSELPGRLPQSHVVVAPLPVVRKDILIFDSNEIKSEQVTKFFANTPGQEPGDLAGKDVTVRETFGSGLTTELQTRYPLLKLSFEKPDKLRKAVEGRDVPIAIVPETMTSRSGYKTARTPDGFLPERTLLAVTTGIDDATRQLLREVATRLDATAVRKAVAAGPASFPQSARRWLDDKGPKLAPVAQSTSPCAGSCGQAPDLNFLPSGAIIAAFLLLSGSVWLVRRFRLFGPSPRRNRLGEDESGLEPTSTPAHVSDPLPPGLTAGNQLLSAQTAEDEVSAQDPEESVSATQVLEHARQDDPEGENEPFVAGRPPKPIRVRLPPVVTSAIAGTALDWGLIGKTTVRAASVRGRTHSYDGEPRQDAYGVRLSSDRRWVIAVVADGLGSAVRAEIAATAAVARALSIIDDDLATDPRLDWYQVMERIAGAITEAVDSPATGQAQAKASAKPATTLTAVVIPAEGPGEVVCAAVGDSPALLLAEGYWQPIVTAEPKAPMLENVTRSLPGAPHAVRIDRREWQADGLLIITTDGFHDSLGDGRTGFAQHVAEKWKKPPGILEFLRYIDFRASGFHDDRTVVAIWGGEHDTEVA
ncbi:hypothetical protein GCM10009555_054610 [Acrocarpospora macrocephala]|uniref:PPM-type phosphatase domain-containing protein n=1 Tax=Acrocarpospora macrocephala TaxID=150177 RepID=A0A5M3X6G3_9ACTN|nr:protein phosphatase 2C domain-containing protein [Acrocarpospora macrocephala]GES14453.1 hypothetical protein Amac_080500 [Acrocarpospora macrocephala]